MPYNKMTSESELFLILYRNHSLISLPSSSYLRSFPPLQYFRDDREKSKV